MTTAMLTPELVLVDPELARAQRQTTYGKAAMSSTEPANGMFFVDQAQPAPEPEPQISPLTPPAPVEPPPVAAVPESVAEPAPPAAPPAAPSPDLAPLPTTPMVDVPLGTLIFRAGLLAEEQLEDALQEGMRTGKRLGEVLIERGWIAEKDLGRMLAGQKGLPYVEVTAAEAEPEALRALPEQNARLQVALPLHYEDGELVVAVADPSNELVIENLRRALGSEPKLVVAPHGELLRAIGEAYGRLTAPAPEPPAAELTPEPEPEPLPPPRAVEPAPAPEPVAPPAVAEPAPAPEPAPQLVAPAPEPQVEAQPEPRPEPVQPLASPAPLPTVLPPPEERSAEPELVQPLQAPVVEAAPEPVQPVSPAPVPAPAAEAPPPVVEQPLAQPEPVAPVAPEGPAQPVAEVAQIEPAEPAPPPAPAPVAEAPAPAEPPVEAPPQPAAEPQTETVATHHVALRLQDGETLQVGSFSSDVEASTWAQEIVRQIASAEGQSTWPFFANRYLRPDTIVSIDLVAESEEKWLGSSVRSRWAEAKP